MQPFRVVITFLRTVMLCCHALISGERVVFNFMCLPRYISKSLSNRAMMSAYLQEARRHESQIARLSLTSKDCTNLMPGEPPDDQARIKALTEESKVLEEELIEVEAKNRLYTLLGERTRSACRP